MVLSTSRNNAATSFGLLSESLPVMSLAMNIIIALQECGANIRSA